jgi:hypothetical protein
MTVSENSVAPICELDEIKNRQSSEKIAHIVTLVGQATNDWNNKHRLTPRCNFFLWKKGELFRGLLCFFFQDF